MKDNNHTLLDIMKIFKAKIEGRLRTSTMITAATTIIGILVKATETVETLMMEEINTEVNEGSSEIGIVTRSHKEK